MASLATLLMFSPYISPVSAQPSLKLVATTEIVGDIIKNIVADKANVNILMSRGVDPHEYQPTSSDSELIQNADHIFYIGQGIEEVLANTLEGFSAKGKATSFLDLLSPEDIISSQGGINPHFWLNPLLVEGIIDNITQVLISIDPTNSDFYIDRAGSYRQTLRNLDSELFNLTSSVPEKKRFLVTQHDAFVYWAERYGFESRALEGVSTSDQVSLKEIDDLAQYLKENEIEVIFLENTVPDTQVQSLIDASAAIGWSVKSGGVLYSGSLGDGEASTYTGMLKVNTVTIVQSILNPPAGVGSQDVSFLLFPVFAGIVGVYVIKRKKVEVY